MCFKKQCLQRLFGMGISCGVRIFFGKRPIITHLVIVQSFLRRPAELVCRRRGRSDWGIRRVSPLVARPCVCRSILRWCASSRPLEGRRRSGLRMFWPARGWRRRRGGKREPRWVGSFSVERAKKVIREHGCYNRNLILCIVVVELLTYNPETDALIWFYFYVLSNTSTLPKMATSYALVNIFNNCSTFAEENIHTYCIYLKIWISTQ